MTAFDGIAATYDATPNPLLALEQRYLEPLLPDMRSLTVVDVGAGTGRWLRRLRAAKTLAVDCSAEMLARGSGDRVIADASQLPFQDAIADLVLCTFMFGYAPLCFPELARITRKTLIVTDVHPEATARGWSRLAEHYPYRVEDLSHPGLIRQRLLEPHIAEPERPLFAAKPHLFEPACEIPAIFIGVWTKR